MSTICVFCASSSAVPRAYTDAAAQLGRLIGEQGHTLLYGGTRMGTMGALAQAAQDAGAPVVAVVPQAMVDAGLPLAAGEEHVITRDLHERKAAMISRADAFIVLAGGFGTLDELLACITLKHLHEHTKAVAIVNTDNYFAGLLQQFDRLFADRFAHPDYAALYTVVETPAAALAAIATHDGSPLPRQWL